MTYTAANSHGPLAVIRELGIDCELVEIADGMAIWESATVMRYLCNISENGDKLYPTDPLKRAQIDLALDWRQTSLYPW
jgi:glutathione S-transferase